MINQESASSPLSYNAGAPLVARKARGTKSITPKLHNQNLANKGADPHYPEDIVAQNATENIQLVVHLARINFVEQLHQNKDIEHNGVVLRGWGSETKATAIGNAEDLVAGPDQHQGDGQLIYRMPYKTQRNTIRKSAYNSRLYQHVT